MPDHKQHVLFLGTGNSCRGQMAEGFMRELGEKQYQVFSAGIEPKGEVNPLAVRVMEEIGIDISTQETKAVKRYEDYVFDLVITLSAEAQRNCPSFLGDTPLMHWPFDPPSAARGSEQDKLQVFRRVRDALKQRIEKFLAENEAREG